MTLWLVQSDSGSGDGWELENSFDAFEDGLRSLREFQKGGLSTYRLIEQKAS